MNKFAPQGIVAQSFSHSSLSTAVQGDLVQIVGDMEVGIAVGAANGRPIGRIITIDYRTQLVVVELFSAAVFELLVGATAVVAGNRVKAAAPNAPALGNTVIPGAAGDGVSFGIALNGGATGATINVVALG